MDIDVCVTEVQGVTSGSGFQQERGCGCRERKEKDPIKMQTVLPLVAAK